MLEPITDQRRGIDRRIRRFSFRFPDRRFGFVRRQILSSPPRTAFSRMLAAYRDKPRLVAMVLVSVVLLNLADLVLTLRAIEVGAVELNPIMAALIDIGPLPASLFKTTIVFGVVAVMWAMRRYRLVLEASLVLMGGYLALIGYSASMLVAGG